MEPLNQFRGNSAFQFNLRAAEQGLAEGPVPHKIAILLRLLHPGSHLPQSRLDRYRKARGGHGLNLRLAQKLQSMPLGVIDEFVKITGLVGLLEVFMSDVKITHPGDLGEFFPHGTGIGIVTVLEGGLQKGKKGARLTDPLRGTGSPPRVEFHHFPQSGTRARTGERVEADIGHADRRQQTRAERQELIPDGSGDPRINPVRDDIVKGPESRTDVLQAHGMEFDIGKLQRRHTGLRFRNVLGREIDPHKLAARPGRRERQQIPSAGASYLQHPGALQGAGLHSEKRRDHCQIVRMRLRVSGTLVRNLAVRIGRVTHVSVKRGLFHPGGRSPPRASISRPMTTPARARVRMKRNRLTATPLPMKLASSPFLPAVYGGPCQEIPESGNRPTAAICG